MTRRRTLGAAAVLLSVLSVLSAACGADATTRSTAVPSPTTTTTTTAAAPSAKSRPGVSAPDASVTSGGTSAQATTGNTGASSSVGPPPTAAQTATTAAASSGGSTPGTLRATPVVAAGLDAPLAVVLAPDGRWWVAEKAGRVVEVDPGTGTVADTAILDLSDEVSTGGEQGLLGMALSPDAGRLYVSYTDPEGTSRVDEYPLANGRPNRAARRNVLQVEQPFANHNGGHIAFGPDGYLYLGFGDGGSAGDPQGNGQNLDTLLGKLLRIDPFGSPYSIPDDNPFARGGGAPEIWAAGLRNPWRFSFDRATGDLWIGDVGQNELEEIDLLPRTDGWGRGVNLGWDAFEGTARYDDDTPIPARHAAPVYEYEHSDGGCSVTGGYVYRGRRLPALSGWYVFADYCVDRIEALAVRGPGDVDVVTVATVPGKVVSFAQDVDGELLILTTGPGQILRLGS